MIAMQYNDIKKLSSQELKDKLVETQKSLYEINFKNSIAPWQVKDSSQFKKLKKIISWIKMAQGENSKNSN